MKLNIAAHIKHIAHSRSIG